MNSYTAKITITLRGSILDVQGKTVEHALHSLHMPQLTNVRIGKYVEMAVQAPDADTAYEVATTACQKLVANPVMEDFVIDIVEAPQGQLA
jgi:phosphoribosylformylglycinamidine synthase PurS subunit